MRRLAWLWLLLLGVAAAVSAASADIWPVDGLHKIFVDDRPGRATSVVLELCRGEVGGFQVAVRSQAVRLDEIDVQPFTLHGDNAALEVPGEAIYREHYVAVTVPSGNAVTDQREWPDALLPRAFVTDRHLAPERTAAFWVDVAVPPDAAPGSYRGECPVVTDGATTSLPVELRVLDLAMPVERHVRANVAVYYDSALLDFANQHWRPADQPWTKDDPDFVAAKSAVYALLLEHRFCAYDLPVPMTSNAADRWYTDPRVHSIRLPWLDDHGSAALLGGVERARERGAFDKLYYYASDEPQPAAYPSLREAAERLHRIAPGVPFVSTVAPVAALDGAVDIWCPNLGNYVGLGYLDTDRLAAERATGRGTWWYTCCVPLAPYPTWLVDDDAVAPRASIWLMARYGLTGFVYSMAHGWSPDPYSSVASFNNTNGDGLLIYPGQPYGSSAPFPSLRLKLLRDGLQDYEILRLLALESAAAAERLGLDGYDGWDRVRALAEWIVGAPYQVSRTPGRLTGARHEALTELLAARRDGLVTQVARDDSGTHLSGVVNPGTPLLVDGRAVPVDNTGHWSTDLAEGAASATIDCGEPLLRLRRETRSTWPTVAPEPPFAVAQRSGESLVCDGRLDEAAWQLATPLTLANGSVYRFAWDDEALWVAVERSGSGVVVLDPGRTHEAAYTFVFTDSPQRALRRTEEGRDGAYQPEWQAAAGEGGLEARIPFAALGGRPEAGQGWGATVIGRTRDSRAFWFDHHGDLRLLPELRF